MCTVQARAFHPPTCHRSYRDAVLPAHDALAMPNEMVMLCGVVSRLYATAARSPFASGLDQICRQRIRVRWSVIAATECEHAHCNAAPGSSPAGSRGRR